MLRHCTTYMCAAAAAPVQSRRRTRLQLLLLLLQCSVHVHTAQVARGAAAVAALVFCVTRTAHAQRSVMTGAHEANCHQIVAVIVQVCCGGVALGLVILSSCRTRTEIEVLSTPIELVAAAVQAATGALVAGRVEQAVGRHVHRVTRAGRRRKHGVVIR